MEKRKNFRGSLITGFILLFACLLLYVSSANYKLEVVDHAIFYFGSAMIVGMLSIAHIISIRLDRKISHLEKLIEKLMERLEDKEN
ncbi:MAG TPA: hypothetical protein ENH94_10130 [Phycisphaerales bacterium]|nr:hypothetical protein [Phycisphaerales bacterium]